MLIPRCSLRLRSVLVAPGGAAYFLGAFFFCRGLFQYGLTQFGQTFGSCGLRGIHSCSHLVHFSVGSLICCDTTIDIYLSLPHVNNKRANDRQTSAKPERNCAPIISR